MRPQLAYVCGPRVLALILLMQLGLGSAAAKPVPSPPHKEGAVTANVTQLPARPGSGPSLNVYLSGGSVRPAAAVAGDLVALAGRIVVDQEITDDVLAGGGSIDLRAPVGGDVRALAADVSIESKIGGDLDVSAGNISLLKSAVIGQAVSLVGGKVLVEGRINGPLKVRAQEIVLNGAVNGDAVLDAESIELGPHARLAGALTYSAKQELSQNAGAVVLGTLTRTDDSHGPGGRRARLPDADEGSWTWHREWSGPTWTGTLLAFLALLACAAVFLVVFPRFSNQAASRVAASPGASLVIGFGALIGLPLLALMLFITILGIPLGFTLLALYPAALLTGYLVGVLFLAERARQALHKAPPEQGPQTFKTQMGYFALALLLMLLLEQLPYVGVLVLSLVTMAGVGACGLELHRKRKSGDPPATEDRQSHGLPASGIAPSTV